MRCLSWTEHSANVEPEGDGFIVVAAAAVVAIGGGSYGIATAVSGGGSAPAGGGSSASSSGAAAGPGYGKGSNARSGPAAGGTAGTVVDMSSSGFTVTTSAGQKVTIDEASATKYLNGNWPHHVFVGQDFKVAGAD
jgi:hypothetical protein